MKDAFGYTVLALVLIGCLVLCLTDKGPENRQEETLVQIKTESDRLDYNRLKPLIAAIVGQESNGDNSATGKNGELGCLQIRKIMVDDVNCILGFHSFSYEDRLDPVRSREIFLVYTNHYSKGESFETIARRWNGGPIGDTKKSTERYWKEVEARL